MHGGDDERDEQNDLHEFQQLLKRDHSKSTLLVVFVDTTKERIQVDNVIPLGCEKRTRHNKECHPKINNLENFKPASSTANLFRYYLAES